MWIFILKKFQFSIIIINYALLMYCLMEHPDEGHYVIISYTLISHFTIWININIQDYFSELSN